MTSVGGKIAWIPCSIARDSFSIWLCHVSLLMAIKLLTYTSFRVTRPSECLFKSVLDIFCNITSSNLLGISSINSGLSMRFRAVSDPEKITVDFRTSPCEGCLEQPAQYHPLTSNILMRVKRNKSSTHPRWLLPFSKIRPWRIVWWI